jgi:origin recognition complex subunit 5
LERTVIACKAAGQNDDEPALEGIDVRCENISALVVHLQRLLQGKRKFILLFDGIDRQREAPQTLLPAIARLGEIVRLS